MKHFDHTSGQHLEIKGAHIYFEVTGDPSGRPLVLLHGGLGNMADFNIILDKLPSHFKLIGIDLRGHGKSTRGSGRLSYAQYQSDVQTVLNHLGVEKFSLLGFSDGGIVGYRMAAQSPAQVEKLLTLGSQWRLEEDDPSIADLKGLTSGMWCEMFPESVAYYEKINPQPDFDGLVKEVVSSLWLDTQETGYPQESVRDIKSPLLIARGDEDHLLSLEEAVQLRKRVEGASFLNIPFAGHAAHEDSTDIFVEAVRQFLNLPLEG